MEYNGACSAVGDISGCDDNREMTFLVDAFAIYVSKHFSEEEIT
ncbi:hypothetical protein D3OALGA1CA_2395 [Olavius algarvensis associated proteobacterium Delta 3]|nr:hypothetical protein D3OALGB2SA_298 [Olavius algarvensis associated proteobacterium Delta 3]CAB5117847.1 hypothetical protein D3OALGA1CA_2395 [Olavius algarvensis associated proteobacterium Delta 3]